MKYVLLSFVLFLSQLAFSQTTMDVFQIARKGSLNEIKELYEADKNSIDSISTYTFSPLILACYHNNNDVALFILENSKNIDHVSNNGTALMAAVYQKNAFLAEKVIEKKADINAATTRGETALMLAVSIQSIEMTKLLLTHNADVSLQNSEGKTAFELAIQSQNQEIINELKK